MNCGERIALGLAAAAAAAALVPAAAVAGFSTQLVEVTGQFDMQTQPQLLLLQKTMVVVEGVARMLGFSRVRLMRWKDLICEITTFTSKLASLKRFKVMKNII